MCYSFEGGWILQTQFPDPLECSKQTNKQNDFLFIPPIEISRGFSGTGDLRETQEDFPFTGLRL